MTHDDAAGPVAVTQADRDAAADVWRDNCAKVGEVMAEKMLRRGGMDQSGIVRAFARHRLAAAPVVAPGGVEAFQARVQPWLMACFGEMIAGNREERNHRFLEEALELVQSCGCTASEAHQLVDYVYGRPIGEPVQEVGGVMVTLAALCLANSLDMHDAAETELARIWTKVEAIRAKQAAKPKHSPLPEHTPRAQPASSPDQAGVGEVRKARAVLADILGVPVADAFYMSDGLFNYDRAIRRIIALTRPTPDTYAAGLADGRREGERYREALEPSGYTKAAYSGEITYSYVEVDEFGDERTVKRMLEWTTIKEVMAMIRARAAFQFSGEAGR